MTTIRYTRCVHCGDHYEYVTSGKPHGFIQNANYCLECYRVVLEALKAIPRKFERTWTPTDEVTLEMLQEWEKEAEKEDLAKGLPHLRRVSSPLYQLAEQGGTVAQVARIVLGRGEFAFRIFQYAYWPGKENEVVLTEEVERNCATGETRPWNMWGD